MNTFPEAFVRQTNELLRDEAAAFFRSLETPAPVSIRFNPLKPIPRQELPFRELFDGRVEWCEQGVYLRERPSFTLDPAWHGGGYYVQEASSMFLAHALRQVAGEKPVRVLDLCAAPGGKSTLGIGVVAEGSLWVANEVVAGRAAVLKENMVKWGSERVVVTRGDPSRFASMPGAFDLVLVDAPCSGEGMFRKDRRAVEEWSERNARACEERQRRIAKEAWACLSPGGHLIYSTCTYRPGENERVLEWLAGQPGARPVEISHDFAGIAAGDSSLPCYRFYPHRTRGEGFFTGALRKEDGAPFLLPAKEGRVDRVALPPVLQALARDAGDCIPYLAGEVAGIVPRAHAGFIRCLEKRVGVLYKGCELGEAGGKMAHSLALWARLPREKVATREVDAATALRYLRKEDARIDAPRGEWAIVTHRSLALGWVKGVGGRANNYYPKEWRVRAGGS